MGLSAGGRAVLHPVMMKLSAAQLHVLLGPAGAGKTTLLRLLAGPVRPSKGRILAEGQDVTGRPVRRRSVSMGYKQFINYPSMTVFENIASPLRVAIEGVADRTTATSGQHIIAAAREPEQSIRVAVEDVDD
jgi:glycerol transport system ATP-binding protein